MFNNAEEMKEELIKINKEIPFNNNGKLNVINSKSRSNIPALYLFNPTIRNPDRIISFYNLISSIVKKYGYNTPINLTNIISCISEGNKNLFNINNEELDQNSISKKFSELKSLGFIDFISKQDIETKDKTFIFSQTKFPLDIFENIEFNEDDKSLKQIEDKSSLFLFILKKNGLLNFLLDLIYFISETKNNSKKYIFNEELRLIYRVFPYLIDKKKNNAKNIGDFIISYREEHAKLKKKKQYRTFLMNKSDEIVTKNPHLLFNKYDTCKDYVDVLIRVLSFSYSFSVFNTGGLKTIKVNPYYIFKNLFFYNNNIKDLQNLIINKRLYKHIEDFEKKQYLNTMSLEIKDPIKERITRFIEEKSIIYFNYDDPDELETIHEMDKEATRGWSNFENMNNTLISYQIKNNLRNFILKKENTQFAIKFDEEGNHLQATTPGICDFMIKAPEFNIIVESSLRHNYNLRVNEYVQVYSHAEEEYFKDIKPMLVFIVVKKTNNHFISDFKLKSFCNFKCKEKGIYKDIIYIPIEYENYKNIMTRKNGEHYFSNLFKSLKQQLSTMTDIENVISYKDLSF